MVTAEANSEATSEVTSLLPGVHEAAGARFREGDASPAWPRHYGDPAGEYRAAVDSCAVLDRTYRVRWKLGGRDPARMLDGMVTNTIPPAPGPAVGDRDPPEVSDGGGGIRVLKGKAPYGVTLTAKGKMVSDHRLLRLTESDGDAFLLDLPAAGVAGMQAHFDRFLPPRFARVEDVSSSTGMLTVVGPRGAAMLATALTGVDGLSDLPGDLTPALDELEADDFLLLVPPGDRSGEPRENSGSSEEGGDREGSEGLVRVLRSGDLGPAASGAPPVFDVIASRETLVGLRKVLSAAACTSIGRSAWETLRVEGGRPAFGVDMDESTIPVEAGVHDRAIDYEKGCYTGQEVIVRIRDLGRVNRHLRRLLLEDGPVPARGTDLFRADGGRVVGRITSAVDSPRFGRVVALGYVRREIEPPGQVRLGSAEGPLIEVRSLTAE